MYALVKPLWIYKLWMNVISSYACEKKLFYLVYDIVWFVIILKFIIKSLLKKLKILHIDIYYKY